MAEIINKYQGGKIYKIVCRVTNLVYIGSTTEKYLSDRLKGHRSKFKTKLGNITSFKVLESGDYYIELVELFPCNSKDELLVRERYYFDVIDCVNKLKPKITIEEEKERIIKQNKKYYEENKYKLKEYQKKYRENNEDKKKEQKKKYYEENKEQVKKQIKKYYQNNIDKIKEREKEYYQNNKDKIKEINKQRRLKLKEQNNQSSSALTI
jgi:hypothetical protein